MKILRKIINLLEKTTIALKKMDIENHAVPTFITSDYVINTKHPEWGKGIVKGVNEGNPERYDVEFRNGNYGTFRFISTHENLRQITYDEYHAALPGANTPTFAAGDRVKRNKKNEWGTGMVIGIVDADPIEYEVIFKDRITRYCMQDNLIGLNDN